MKRCYHRAPRSKLDGIFPHHSSPSDPVGFLIHNLSTCGFFWARGEQKWIAVKQSSKEYGKTRRARAKWWQGQVFAEGDSTRPCCPEKLQACSGRPGEL